MNPGRIRVDWRLALTLILIGGIGLFLLDSGPSSSQAVAQSNDGVPISKRPSARMTSAPGFGNSIRYASALSGAPDYATFKNG